MRSKQQLINQRGKHQPTNKMEKKNTVIERAPTTAFVIECVYVTAVPVANEGECVAVKIPPNAGTL